MAWRHFKALMWKNWLLKKRSPVSACCECALPFGFVLIMIALYQAFSTETYTTQAFTNPWGPASFLQGKPEQVLRVCPVTVLPFQLQYANQKIAVVASNPAAQPYVTQFMNDMQSLYTAFNGTTAAKDLNGTVRIPSLAGLYVPNIGSVLTTFPGGQAEMEQYIRGSSYAVGNDPLIWAAIVFNSGPPNWDIAIRMNLTEVPSTLEAPVDTLQRGYTNENVKKYVYAQRPQPGGPFQRRTVDPLLYRSRPGFMSLQLMVDRWIINQTTTAPMDPFSAMYSFMYMMSNTVATGNQYQIFSDFQTLLASDPQTAGIIAGRVTSWMASERYLPQTVDLVPFPITAYTTNDFYTIVSQMFALFFVICFLFPVSRLIRGLVTEKEMKIREGMRMMGLTDSALFGSWLVTYAVLYLILAIAITVVTKPNIFKASNGGFVFVFFFLFGLSSITYCYLISVFFSRAKTASTLGVVLFLASFFPWFAVNPADYSTTAKNAASLLSTTAFGLGLDQLAAFENEGQGISFNNATLVVRNYSIATAMAMMFFDFILYGLLAIYADAVLPARFREFGVPRPWYFPVMPSYWREICNCGRTAKQPTATSPLLPSAPAVIELPTRGTVVNDMKAHRPDPRFIEEPDASRRSKEREGKAVAIRGLTKVFSTPDGPKTAVDHIDMTMYEGDIFVLLGHNGAGKSTTINMLSGMLEPSSGKMSVFGQDLSHDLTAIRKDMGVCPQHDVLWPDLTVREHLRLYADIKGIPPKKINAEIDEAIKTVGLTEKVNVQSSKLSGGQRRKLSVCIALLGGSRVVFLDEPTSGMDPYSRRSTWQILQNSREGRVMVLTTHFMDEADLLGDRICIMAKGQVRCCGSPMFLKRAYGVGYVLTIVKQPNVASSPLLQVIKKHIQDVTVSTDVGAELAVRLALDDSARFPQLFEELDVRSRELGIVTYGVGITTMEEVFLKVAHQQEDAPPPSPPAKSFLCWNRGRKYPAAATARVQASPTRQHQDLDVGVPIAITNPAKADNAIATPVKREFHEEARGGCAVHKRHFRAMLIKRYHISRFDFKALCYQLFIPVIMVLGGLALLKAAEVTGFPEYQFTTANFNVNARQNAASPIYPNYVPFFSFKTSVDADSQVDPMVDFFGSMKEPNVTTTIPRLQLNSSAASSLVDPNNFITDPYEPTRLFQQMSAFLIDDKASYAASKYGAYVPTANGTYFPTQPAATLPPNSSIFTYSLFHNTTAVHAAPLFMNLLNSHLYAAVTGDSSASITARTAPLPFTKRQAALASSIFSFGCAVIILIAFSFIPASYAIAVVKEREVKAKHQQLISGVSLSAYWAATFVFDNLTYILPAGLSIALCKAFNIAEFIDVEQQRAAALVLLFILYGLSVSAFTYMLTFLFRSHSTAQNVVLFINVFCMILMIASLIMSQVTSTCRADEVLRYIYRLLPGFCLGNGLLQLSFLDLLPAMDATCDNANGVSRGPLGTYNALDFKAVGTNLVYMAAETIGYLLITLAIDVIQSHPRILLWCQRDPKAVDPPFQEDEDVIAERERVGAGSGDVISIRNLRKVYHDGKVAVKNLSYGVAAGEVFGFLGINGAGKTTTLQMLSGDVLPSSGTATLAGFDIILEQPKVRRLLGYCPQWDALLELLTTRQHLELYARIKGVPESELDETVDEQLRRMDLVEFQNKKAGTLSGGNKRKLSVAIALIGPGNVPPPIIFLDEPSTGMDPVARRFMWKVIAEVATRDKSCSIILTTHSMEECEALCTRTGIMVGGRLQCVGSNQHLKSKFGNGYQMEIKQEEPTPEHRNAVANSVRAALGAAAANTNLIRRADLVPVARALGNVERVRLISENGSGWALDAAFENSRLPRADLPPRDGNRAIPLVEFANWWAAEECVGQLCEYIQHQAFPGSSLLERQGNQLRFRVPPQRDSLSSMFNKIESAKTQLRILSYTLGQTTLEQIFNDFARHQQEEKGMARGFAEVRVTAEGATVLPASNPMNAGVRAV